jgi:hypothetical protein
MVAAYRVAIPDSSKPYPEFPTTAISRKRVHGEGHMVPGHAWMGYAEFL